MVRNQNLSFFFINKDVFRDLEDTILPVYKTTKHKGIINAIDGMGGLHTGCGAPEIVTGSKDGEFL